MEAGLQGLCVGIDVSKNHWDVAIAAQRRVQRFTADAAGLAALLTWLKQLSQGSSAWKRRVDTSDGYAKHYTGRRCRCV